MLVYIQHDDGGSSGQVVQIHVRHDAGTVTIITLHEDENYVSSLQNLISHVYTEIN
jgi:hypothetical protein